jgi:1-acyl-sn-glycerol-3-phosphate acyltransferase
MVAKIGYFAPVKSVFGFCYVVYALLLFMTILVPVFLLSLGASLLGDLTGGNLIYRLCRTWADIWFPAVGIYHRNIYEYRPDPANACIYVANHTSYLDAPLIVKAVRFPVRPLGKIEMTRVPLFGFVYRKTIVVVDRSDPEHRAESVRKLVAYLNRGISIFIFPEGSRNETEYPLKSFYDGAFRIAIETGRPLQPVLFLDSRDRMNFRNISSLNPGKSRAVFLEPIGVEGMQPEDIPALKDHVHDIMEKKLLEYRG